MISHGSNSANMAAIRGRLPSNWTVTVTERMRSRRAFVQIAEYALKTFPALQWLA